ncbi:MAG TPA: selenocysteine-specific translation elongation factor [Acidimicrobiia bacterium]|nr:selenocysteine-specific translation elongation factor [Acidimicrobiia bacterium]
MPVIGTAGHVDHGKSTLITALTGRDPDRFEEEKRRGLTIDLGFSWMTLPGGVEVSFVDVPGHDRYMKNMLAGAGGIDVGMLVVAADEGWKPQTEEHLAVLDLLGVDRAVVALTKIDRVDPDTQDMVELDIAEKLEGTSVASAPVVPVAAPTGQGLTELVAALQAAVMTSEPSTASTPRVWVDRVFSMAGAGTVVTGTLVEGTLSAGDEVGLWPPQIRSRIKAIQVHEQPRSRVKARSRVAVVLAGVDRSAPHRGDMLGPPRDVFPTRRFTASIRPARYETVLKERGSYHLHVGSAATATKVRLLDSEHPDFAVLDLDDPLPLRVGDVFILRDVGRRLVVGGGRVLDPQPSRSRSSMVTGALRMSHVVTGEPDAKADALLEVRGRDSLRVLSAHSGGGRPSNGTGDQRIALSAQEAAVITARIREAVETYQTRYLWRVGIPIVELATQMELPPAIIEKLVATEPGLRMEGSAVSSGAVADPTTDERWPSAAARLEATGLVPISPTDLDLDPELVAALVRNGHLVRISDDLVYPTQHVEMLVDVLRGLDEPFTVGEFREAGHISRKCAVSLLEWADRRGITRRVGDRRLLIDDSPAR